MSPVASSGGAMLLCCHLTFAAFSNWTFDTSRVYLPDDSLRFSCSSETDTVTTHFFLETGDHASGLDTNTDISIFTFTMIDNFTGESWQEDRGIINDHDPIKGNYRFDPGCPALSPAVYLLRVTDRTGCETRKFRVAEFPQPYRIITGTVNTPPGIPRAWNSVSLRSDADATSLSGWTDSSGAYRIAINRKNFEQNSLKMTACVESRYHGFITAPALAQLDLTDNNWNAVNFTFVSASCRIRGTTRLAVGPVPGIRVTLRDTLLTIMARTFSDADGAYEIDCPPGTYLISANSSGDEYPVTSPEIKLLVTETDTVTYDLSMSVSDLAAEPSTGRDYRGNGILRLTVIDSTLAMVDKGAIMVWDSRPGTKTSARPLGTFPLQKTNSSITLVEIPDRKCFVSVELSGNVLGSDCRYSVFAADRHGIRRMFDYTRSDTFECTITLRENDRVRAGWGYGSVDGTVATSLPQEETHIAVLLYDIDRATVERGCTVGGNGAFRIANIPIGAYRLAAAIDTNNDKSPDIITMADTTLTFTGKESYSAINVAFSEKPAGTFHISGQLSGIGAIPANVLLTVAAVPVDTTAPPDLRLDVAAFMKAYRIQVQQGGSFVIDNLPPGTYYVLAAAEETTGESDNTRDLAFGVFGDMLLDNFAPMPVIPRAVAIGDGIAPKPIVISMIMQSRSDGDPLVSGSKIRIPASFALQSAHIDPAGKVRVNFAVPQRTAAFFSIDDMAGHPFAANAETTFAPGFHSITLNLDNRSLKTIPPLFVSMKSQSFHTRQAITPMQALHPEASTSAFSGKR